MPVDLRSQPSGPALCLVKQTQDNTSIRYGRRGRMCFTGPLGLLSGTCAGMRMQPPGRQAYLVTISYYHT